ncbi:MAG: Hdr-like menaquinol oxidoreductase cytochrome c subunit [Sulfuritalea sp.]|nr:Hdr-like menaquinol oxidoreductase cytochrome c subunit [Sulfuritalea sp.]
MKLLRILATALTALIAVSPAPTLAGEGGRTAKPLVEIANPGKCVAPAEEMRRNHMEMLKHQRDRTLRQGIRGEPASLNACIECHASKATGSVLGAAEGGKGRNFCESCHSYVAVKLDCFECHQPKAKFKAAGLKP